MTVNTIILKRNHNNSTIMAGLAPVINTIIFKGITTGERQRVLVSSLSTLLF